MNVNDTSTQLLFTTVPIIGETPNGIVSGTGFFFSYQLGDDVSVPLILTNYHVLKDVTKGMFTLNIGKDGLPTKQTLNVNFDETIIKGSQIGKLDLMAYPVAPILHLLNQNGKQVFYRSIDNNLIPDKATINQLTALEEITFIGYPNGLYDNFNKTPLIRRGWTSTPIWNDYKGNKEFLIDASVFPGSSGSPAFIFNQGSYPTCEGITVGSRLLFVGVVTSTITENCHEHLDLGKVIRFDAIMEELKPFVENLLKDEIGNS